MIHDLCLCSSIDFEKNTNPSDIWSSFSESMDRFLSVMLKV